MQTNDLSKRRAFLKKALAASALGAAASAAGINKLADDSSLSSGVVVGRAKKHEVLYKKTLNWEKFYKIAY